MVKAAPGKRRPLHVLCPDWRIAIDGLSVRLTPSARTVGNQFAFTLLAAIMAGVIVLMFGLPPGSNRVKAQQKRVATLEAALELAQQQERRVASSTSGRGSVPHQNAERLVERTRQQLDHERRRLADTRPTWGPTGDRVYWSAIGLLTLAGLFFPVVALVTRCRLSYEGPPGRGVLTVYERDVYPRINRFEVEHFLVMGVHVGRLITRHRGGRSDVPHTIDHGWRWTIVLATDPRDATTRDLLVTVEQEPSLPPDPSRMTSRVRDVVRFLEAVTALEHRPPMVTDVYEKRPGLLGSDLVHRTRVAGSKAQDPGA